MTRIVTLTLNPALDSSTDAEHVAPDLKLRCSAPRADAGGGGVNVSRAIAFLGGQSLAALALGGGPGERVRQLLRVEGIPVHDLGVAVETRQNLSVIARDTGAQYRFIMPGQTWTDVDVDRSCEALCKLARAGDLIVPSGSLPPGVGPGDLVALTNRLAVLGVRIVLDTSGAALQAFATGRAKTLHVLRMDLEEAQSLAGRDLDTVADVAQFGRELVDAGAAKSVIVAKGAEGSILVTSRGQGWHVRPPKVNVVSKTGAGDSFVAGVTLALAQGSSDLEATVRGVGAAASAVTTPDTDLCDGASAERYAALSTVTEL